MSTIPDLIQQLNSASGETLYRVIQELGKRGPEAREAIHTLVMLVRFSEDRVARGHALLAIGQIDPSQTDAACVVDDVGDAEQAARKAAGLLNEEAAKLLVALLVESPIGWLEMGGVQNPPGSRAVWREQLRQQTLNIDRHARPDMARAVWIEQLARQFPGIIPYLVEALTSESVVGDRLPDILGHLGEDHPEVVSMLEPLFDHEAAATRNAAFYACALTRKFPVDALPRLIVALDAEEEDRSRLSFALGFMGELHPRDVLAALIDTLGIRGLNLLGHFIDMLSPPSRMALVEELILLLYSPDDQMKKAAAFQLSARKAEAVLAVPRLRELLDEDNPTVRDLARVAIERIEGRG